MPEQIVIAPSAIEAAGLELHTAASMFERIIDTLAKSAFSNGSETWGNDSYGHQFADGSNGYISSRDNLVRGGRDMAETITQFGTGMIDASMKMTGTEFGNAAAF
ncbi:hypothetical protein [Nocardia sp. NPDC005366]|uniref:hypothetical protein n=1 Tax=Nocardia sp. NPDC005366 TaxID=3156878 RepID=UPI0033A4AE3A